MTSPSAKTGLIPIDRGDGTRVWAPSRLLYYLAGFADADGCFRWSGSTTAASVINCYPWVLEQFRELFRGRIRARAVLSDKHKQCYEWEVTGVNARTYSRVIRPFLREKWRQADALARMMEFPKGSPERDEFIRQLKVLKTYAYLRGD